MAKLPETVAIELLALRDLWKQSVFVCPEVTVGWFGKERADIMSIDIYQTVRCYEIKVTKSDFYSKANNSFVGHFNYYIMPMELYEKVQSDVPDHVGVMIPEPGYRNLCSVKKAKKQELKAELDVLKMSILRSLARDAHKHYKRLRDESKEAPND